MPQFVIPQAIQVVSYYTLTTGEPVGVVVHHFRNGDSDPITQAVADNIADRYNDASQVSIGGSTMRSATVDNLKLAKIGVRDLNQPNLPEFQSAAATVWTGTGATDPVPYQSAICVTLRTAMAGRSFRGRSYLFGFAEGSNGATGNPTSGLVNVCVGYIEAIQTEMSSTYNMDLCVASRKLLEINDVIGVSADAQWDTQRRRSRQV